MKKKWNKKGYQTMTSKNNIMNYPPDVCDQLIEILKYIPKEDYKKIPEEAIKGLYRNCNSERTFIYNQALPLKEQNLLGGTIVALKDFSEKYWHE